ncbi:hypothetical protein J3R83DRAFT_2188 [Lanmaoa asiatica]|nr:hypothetical protein J3R83DRAFT_2188 [Lanmaoa asiatica]
MCAHLPCRVAVPVYRFTAQPYKPKSTPNSLLDFSPLHSINGRKPRWYACDPSNSRSGLSDGSTATYTLIYHFLKQQSQNKAAGAVKKAARACVVLRDDIEQEGPALEDIIKEWKTKENNTKSKGDDTSDSGDSDDDSGEGPIAKKLPQKIAERDTSTTLSSGSLRCLPYFLVFINVLAGENTQEVVKQAVPIPEKKSTKDTENKDKNKGSESDSSDSDSSDSDSSSQGSALDSSDAESSSSSSGSSSSSDSSDEDEANETEKAPPNRTKATEDKSPSTSESSTSEDGSDSESQQKEDSHVAKKRKTAENGTAVTTAVATGSQQIARASQRKEKSPPKVKERFQRVKVQNLAPELVMNNGYEARGGAVNDYGGRAHRDLIVTRGAGFRKEKNKKKRGSYRGGEITMENHSIRFDF